jgi:hypothetical protein
LKNEFRLLRTGFVLSIAFVLAAACFARERRPRVEVVCPSPPIPVTIGKNKVLVYELHLTNFDVVPLTLQRISIFADRENPDPLASLEGEKLSAAMIRIGAPMMMPGDSSAGSANTRTLDPGGRNVVFLWIELPANKSAPANIRHQLVFSSTPAGTDKPSDATLEDYSVPIDQGPVPVLGPPFDGASGSLGMVRPMVRTTAAVFSRLMGTSTRRNASLLTGSRSDPMATLVTTGQARTRIGGAGQNPFSP